MKKCIATLLLLACVACAKTDPKIVAKQAVFADLTMDSVTIKILASKATKDSILSEMRKSFTQPEGMDSIYFETLLSSMKKNPEKFMQVSNFRDTFPYQSADTVAVCFDAQDLDIKKMSKMVLEHLNLSGLESFSLLQKKISQTMLNLIDSLAVSELPYEEKKTGVVLLVNEEGEWKLLNLPIYITNNNYYNSHNSCIFVYT